MTKERAEIFQKGAQTGQKSSLGPSEKTRKLSFRVRTPLNTINILTTNLLESAQSKEVESLKAIQNACVEILHALKEFAEEANVQDGTVPSPEKQTLSSNKTIRGKKILVVEDHQTNRVLLTRLLESAGAIVKGVESGEDAIEMIRMGSAFNIILMDIHLPGISGFETTRRIKKNPDSSKVPIVAMTALSLKGDKDRCLEAGMDGYISKPIVKNELLSVLMELAL